MANLPKTVLVFASDVSNDCRAASLRRYNGKASAVYTISHS